MQHLKDNWLVLTMVLTLVGSGVGWTSYLQTEIAGQIEREVDRAEETYFARRRGEILEVKLEAERDRAAETRQDIKDIKRTQQLILQQLERLK